eukprot:7233315-Prymnesium_polylepis.1
MSLCTCAVVAAFYKATQALTVVCRLRHYGLTAVQAQPYIGRLARAAGSPARSSWPVGTHTREETPA